MFEHRERAGDLARGEGHARAVEPDRPAAAGNSDNVSRPPPRAAATGCASSRVASAAVRPRGSWRTAEASRRARVTGSTSSCMEAGRAVTCGPAGRGERRDQGLGGYGRRHPHIDLVDRAVGVEQAVQRHDVAAGGRRGGGHRREPARGVPHAGAYPPQAPGLLPDRGPLAIMPVRPPEMHGRDDEQTPPSPSSSIVPEARWPRAWRTDARCPRRRTAPRTPRARAATCASPGDADDRSNVRIS